MLHQRLQKTTMSPLHAYEEPAASSSDESDGEAENNVAQITRSHRQQLREAQFQSLYVSK
jgi:hypothetical protein